MSDKQGADDSANMTVEYDDWHYEARDARDIDPVPTQKQAPHLYDWATIGLIAIALLIVCISGLLSWQGKPVPEYFGSALLLDLGGLAGMVAVKAQAKA
jgi:hypothetical protein